MRLLTGENVPVEHVSALRGDGDEAVWSREVDELGRSATDEELTAYAEEHEYVVLTTDSSDFGDMDSHTGILVAPQDMSGGEVRRAVGRLSGMALDPAPVEPIWLSGL